MTDIYGKQPSARNAKKIILGIGVCFFCLFQAAAFAGGTFDEVLYGILAACSGRRDLSEWNARAGEAFSGGIRLQGADFPGAYLVKADLRSADLRGADFRSADLRDADLSFADLRGGDFREADLRGADLRGADLRGTDLAGASVEGIDVRGARFPQGST